jgi:hypothetical protein
MSYTYLLDLYALIEERTGQASAKHTNGDLDELSAEFEKSRIEILQEFRAFLTENYNSKLPRRIRKNYL